LGGGGGLDGRDDCAYVREAEEMEGLAARRAALVNILMMAQELNTGESRSCVSLPRIIHDFHLQTLREARRRPGGQTSGMVLCI